MLNLFMGNPSVSKHTQSRALDGSESIDPIIYGREREKDEIVELLLQPNNRGERLSIIPIVGMGGIGKTTLAQHVFNDDRIVGCFENRVWASISMEYDKFCVYKRIIEAVTSRGCDVQDECSIEDKVRSELRDKKFLIILDDLWNEDTHTMNKFFGPFQCGAPNSKVVITTRNLNIASRVKTVGKSIKLTTISDDDCWSIFCSHARLDTASPLAAIGDKLSKRCAGNPGRLRLSWEAAYEGTPMKAVLNDASLISEKGQYEIMSVLKMSYDTMLDYLKPCFLCCIMFPEDYQFCKEFLVLIWISSGLINVGGKGKMSREEVKSVGCSYFDELVSRSLLSTGNGYYYVMHKLIRDMGTRISGITYCRWENRVGSLEKTRNVTVHGSLIPQINHYLKEDIVHSLPLRIFLPMME